jgi:hypothetical protein
LIIFFVSKAVDSLFRKISATPAGIRDTGATLAESPMNQKADIVSKLVDTDDWQLHSAFFTILDKLLPLIITKRSKRISPGFGTVGSFELMAFFNSERTKIVWSLPLLMLFLRQFNTWKER